MSFYPVSSRPAIPGVEIPGGDQGAARAVMVAVPVSALVWPVRADSGGDGRSALLVAGVKPITAGEPVVWCTVVVTAPALLRRDGRVQAAGRPCDHARLGAAEQELDRRCGPGTIERIAADVRPTGKVKAVARREMSVAATIRAVLLMTVMPDADYREVLTTLLGELTAVPWQRPHTVPSPTVLSTWRAAIGQAPLQQLQQEVLAAVVTEHRDDTEDNDAEHRDTAAPGRGGRRAAAGRHRRDRDPDARYQGEPGRVRFGRAGRHRLPADPPPARLRRVHPGHPGRRVRPGRRGQGRDQGRGRAGAAGPGPGRAARRVHPRPVVDHGPELPGVARIAALLATGSHVLVRVKSDCAMKRSVISPVQRGEMGGISLDPMANPAPKGNIGDSSMPGN